MEPNFTFRCEINRNILNQLKKYILPPGILCLAYVCIGFFCMLSLLYLMGGMPAQAFSYFWPAALIYGEKAIGLEFIVRKILCKKSEVLRFTLNFYKSHFTISGNGEDKGLDVPYSRITRVIQVKQQLVFFTKESMCYPIFEEVQEPEKTEWFLFLKERNPKIKFKHIKKK